MNNRDGFTLIELMIVVVILALLATIAIPNFIKLQDRAKEARVKAGAHSLQIAAEDFAVQNGGVYSDAAADLQPLLPNDAVGGRNIQNPYTSNWTEPQYSAAATSPGQIGILNFLDITGTPAGYTITGWGTEAMVVTITSGQ